MKRFAIVVWSIVGALLFVLMTIRLSPDALGMAVGLVFGVLAGVPTALLVLAANGRRIEDDDPPDEWGFDRVPRVQPTQPQLLAERTTVTVTERVYGRKELPAARIVPEIEYDETMRAYLPVRGQGVHDVAVA